MKSCCQTNTHTHSRKHHLMVDEKHFPEPNVRFMRTSSKLKQNKDCYFCWFLDKRLFLPKEVFLGVSVRKCPEGIGHVQAAERNRTPLLDNKYRTLILDFFNKDEKFSDFT